MLLTEHHLEFLSLKGGCTGSSESTLVKMTHCWKSHIAAKIKILMVSDRNFCSRVPAPLNSLQDYFISLYSEQRQFTETLLSLFIRCSVPGVVLIVSISDICLLPYFLYSHEYRLTRHTVYCSNSGWLPIRCAYFILEINCTDGNYFLCDRVFTQTKKLKQDILVAFDRGKCGLENGV